MSEKWRKFLQYTGEIADLVSATAVLAWDQQTYMPSGGIQTRASQLATLQKHIHLLLTREEVGSLLGELEEEMAHLPYDSFEASLLRAARRSSEKAARLPTKLVSELAHVASLALDAWLRAKAASDFNVFRPHLEELVIKKREQADALGYEDSPYDALLDLYEPGMRTAQVAALFAQLKKELLPLVAAIAERQDLIDDSPMRQHFPEALQWQLCLRALDLMGFDMQRGRLDRAEHPFTTHFSSRDVRLTTNIKPTYLCQGLLSVMHEGGHGLYEQGIPWDFRRTPLAQGATLTVHESQSRLWENIVGRSLLFWQHFLPVARELFPSQLSGVSVKEVYRAVNRVEPSPVRCDADEVTYNLHIFIRFELEQELLSGELLVADLPEAWNHKYRSYLGITPPDDSLGVLQDVHWANGLFGYFPTYALGNILSVQLWETMQHESGLADELVKGRFRAISTWLKENVYIHGAKFTTEELTERVTGGPLAVEATAHYLQTKYGELYGLV